MLLLLMTVLFNSTVLLNMFIASFPELLLVPILLRMLLCLQSPCLLVLLLSFLVSSFLVLLSILLVHYCLFCLGTL